MYNNYRFVHYERKDKKIMKLTKKIFALALAAGMVLSTTSCADESWSYKDDTNTLSIGTYIYYMSGAYGYAQNKLSSSTEDSTEPTQPEDIFSAEIEDQNGEKVNVNDYILREGELACKNLLNINKMFDDMGLKLTAEQLSAAQSNADQTWNYYGKTYESLGVSKESFYNAEYLFAAKYEAIFKALYTKGGEKEVSTDEIKKHFTENYTDYSYFPVNLYSTSTGDDGNTVSTALSENEIDKITKSLNSYKAQINSGNRTYTDFAETYVKENNLESDPTVSNTEILEDSSIGDEIKKAIEGLDTGKADVIKIGEDSSAVMYLVYKGDINEKAKNEFSDDQQYKVLQEMKSDEYKDDLEKAAKEYKCEKNEAAVSKYQPNMFLKLSQSSAG